MILADRIDDSALRWQESAPLAPYAVEMLSRKCDMLKSESGQNAASRGELPSASSSGTAISMLQAAGSKRTNLHQAAINQAFLTMVRQVVSNLAAYGSRDESYRTQEGYAVLGAGDAAGAGTGAGAGAATGAAGAATPHSSSTAEPSDSSTRTRESPWALMMSAISEILAASIASSSRRRAGRAPRCVRQTRGWSRAPR